MVTSVGHSAPAFTAPAPRLDDISGVLFGDRVDISTQWHHPIEDASRHPSQEQPAYSYLPLPDGRVVVNGTRGTYVLGMDGSILWKVDTGYCPTRPALAADGTIVVHSKVDKNHPERPAEQFGISPDGVIQWQRPWVHKKEPADRLEATPDGLLISPEGHVHWGDPLGRFFPLADGRQIMHAYDNGVAVFNPASGQVDKVYRYHEDHPVHVEPDGTTYWWDGRHLRCVEPDFTTQKWSYDFGEGTHPHPQIAVSPDGSTYVMTSDTLKGTAVTVLDTAGNHAWEWQPKGDAAWHGTTPHLNRKPFFTPDGTAWFSGHTCIYAVRPGGQMKFQEYYAETCNEMMPGPHNTIVVSDPSTHLRVLSADNGEILWQSNFLMGHGYPSTMIHGNTIYTATKDAQLAAVTCTPAMERLHQDKPVGTVEQEPAEVFIDGVRVPRRQHDYRTRSTAHPTLKEVTTK